MLRRIVKDKDGNILEDIELTMPKKDKNVISEDSQKEGKNRKTSKKSK